jgi:cytoskeletal protein RodZ
LLVIIGLVGLLLFGSCVAVLASLGEPSGTAVKEAEPQASVSAAPTASKPTEEPSPTTYTPKESDWSLEIKTRDKQFLRLRRLQ